MCFQFLRRRQPSVLQINAVSPIIIVSPLLQPVYTPIIMKRCTYCNGVLYERNKTYHSECFHTVKFQKIKEKEEARKRLLARTNSI